ncbi:glucose 1-dehydrogenase [Mycolicibacterium wolinskyi]|uniref:2-deoxy-D-gluconate 3-dehydrogenase n=1 Tax=Mycolicibacterium wolinskyi TaxID=59750 RepID=A0A1X2F3E5_9MYCO|nr:MULTISPECIES: glucose 1-dehydrogenase [Mycolicibacterium]MCV7287656.1 glucose 1-dehydrogenase [Mycolicibacterium wolinskyi]MCV7294554.1 glucose 1-dehydrogenase [Mycolicibacterium goodii]ORX12559.1 2-deoxy-D-gluconate 3-dehydrogenase [Mycolicibacterium wolinskyi]
MTDLTGKVAIVTGAGRGLGRAMAHGLARAGAAVTVAARTASELDSFVDEVKAAGGQALACPTDITDEASVERMADATVETFGRIDVLVNNSGIVASTPLIDQSADEWDRVVATNLRGTFLATKAAGRHLVAQGSGKVVNIASNFALQGVANHAAYSASKAGVIAFTRSMAIEWSRHNIQVNALAPGYFATPLNAEMRADADTLAKVVRAIPARRMGEPDELTSWLLLLASRASDFMTGEVIVIDGGQSVR